MRLKLDENLGHAAAALLADAGHDVEDVHGERLCAKSDADVLAAAVREDRVLVTLDAGFSDSVRFRPRDATGIVVMRIPGRQRPALVDAAVRTLVAALAQPYPQRVGPRRFLWIVEVGRVRVHQDRDDPVWPDEAGEESPGWEEASPPVQTVNGLPVPRDLGVPALRALVAQGGPAVWAAIQALAERGDDASLAALAEYAGSRDEMLRRASVEAIGRHTRGRAAGSVVLRALRDASPFVVRTACHAAAATGLDEARDAVLIHLGATEASTRAAAAQSLALLAAPSDFDRVLHTSVGDSDPSVRKDAAWTLRTRCAGPDTWRRLFDVWRCDPLPRHRVWACELAAEFGGAEADELLRPFAADPDGHVRKAAASRQSGTTG